jgi:hypothetical protein
LRCRGTKIFNRYFLNILADYRAEESPLRRQFAPLLLQRGVEGQGKDYPTVKCLPAGVPMGDLDDPTT